MERGVRGRYMSDYGINHIEVDKLVKFCKEARGEDLVLLLRTGKPKAGGYPPTSEG